MTPSIEEIVTATKEASPYFFDAPTLKGFGQTISDFIVARSPKGNIYIYAPSYWGKPIGDSHLRVHALGNGYHRIQESNQYPRLQGRELMGYTFRQFKDNDLKICRCPTDLESILEFIENN